MLAGLVGWGHFWDKIPHFPSLCFSGPAALSHSLSTHHEPVGKAISLPLKSRRQIFAPSSALPGCLPFLSFTLLFLLRVPPSGPCLLRPFPTDSPAASLPHSFPPIPVLLRSQGERCKQGLRLGLRKGCEPSRLAKGRRPTKSISHSKCSFGS